jgi:hypothetical protein
MCRLRGDDQAHSPSISDTLSDLISARSKDDQLGPLSLLIVHVYLSLQIKIELFFSA